jgi:hypothetical protein
MHRIACNLLHIELVKGPLAYNLLNAAPNAAKDKST